MNHPNTKAIKSRILSSLTSIFAILLLAGCTSASSSILNESADSVINVSGYNSTIANWGISLTDSSGPKELKIVVDQMWSYLNNHASGSGPLTKDDMRISLQPGNSVYSILNQLFDSQEAIDAVAQRLIDLSK